MPDDLLGVDRLAVYDSRHLAVGAARVKADAAAVRMAADLSGLLVRLRKARLVREDDLKRALVHVLHETDVELALPARAVLVLHTLCNRVVAAEVHAPAADAPQEHLDAALSITVVCLGECRAAQLRLVYGHKAVFTLDRDFERALRAFFICAGPDAEGNKRAVQRGQIPDLVFNA